VGTPLPFARVDAIFQKKKVIRCLKGGANVADDWPAGFGPEVVNNDGTGGRIW